jgi:hypothetical protein
MPGVTLILLLSAAAPVAVALPNFNGVQLSAGEAQLYSELFSQHLTARGAKVTTARDMAAVLGLERQRAVLGGATCDEACATELGLALGVDVLALGDLGRTESGFALGVKLLSARNGAVLAFFSATPANEKALIAELDRCAWDLLRQLKGKLAVDVDPGPAPAVRTGVLPLARGWGWAPLAVGAVGVGLGTAAFFIASGHFTLLQTTTSPEAALSARESGKQAQVLGAVGVTVGAAAMVTGLAMLLLGQREVEVAAWATPQAAGLAVGGTFP